MLMLWMMVGPCWPDELSLDFAFFSKLTTFRIRAAFAVERWCFFASYSKSFISAFGGPFFPTSGIRLVDATRVMLAGIPVYTSSFSFSLLSLFRWMRATDSLYFRLVLARVFGLLTLLYLAYLSKTSFCLSM